MEHLPTWAQAVIALGLGLGALLGGMIWASRRGVRLFAAGGVSERQMEVLKEQLRLDVAALRQSVNESFAVVFRKLDEIHDLERDVAVMKERQSNNVETLRDLARRVDQLDRRRFTRGPS